MQSYSESVILMKSELLLIRTNVQVLKITSRELARVIALVWELKSWNKHFRK
jgi:hypothetical protein